jgi:hypothetical protein
MDKRASKVPISQSDVAYSSDYERGLKILGRLIAHSIIRKQSLIRPDPVQKQFDVPPE